jgi:hypothetical protein
MRILICPHFIKGEPEIKKVNLPSMQGTRKNLWLLWLLSRLSSLISISFCELCMGSPVVHPTGEHPWLLSSLPQEQECEFWAHLPQILSKFHNVLSLWNFAIQKGPLLLCCFSVVFEGIGLCNCCCFLNCQNYYPIPFWLLIECLQMAACASGNLKTRFSLIVPFASYFYLLFISF